MTHLLLALQHGDTAFPSGGFAFSQGLEGWAAERGRPPGEALFAFLVHQIRHRWASADRLALLRAHRAADPETVANVDRAFDRTQVIAVLARGSRRNGRALLGAHRRMGTPGAGELEAMAREGRTPGHLPVIQGALWQALGMDAECAARTAGYAFAAGLLTAAVRLNLIGAIAAQHALGELLPEIEAAAARPADDDRGYSSFTPFAEIAAMRGATGDSRLFSN